MACVNDIPSRPRHLLQQYVWSQSILLAIMMLTTLEPVIVAADSCATDTEDSDTDSSPAVDDPAPEERPMALKFKVIRADTSEALPRAKIEVMESMHAGGWMLWDTLHTNEQGEAGFSKDRQSASLQARVELAGFVPYLLDFGWELRLGLFSKEKTIPLTPGKRIGGTVVDLSGNPVANARIYASIPATDAPTEFDFTLFSAQTGFDGRWSFDGAPQDVRQLTLNISHQQFLAAHLTVQDRIDGFYPLDPGVKLTGRVTDSQGNAVPNASITVMTDDGAAAIATGHFDADGTFVIPPLTPQRVKLIATAQGFAPQINSVDLFERSDPVAFELSKGNRIRFQLIDEQQQPVKGVWISATRWRNVESNLWAEFSDADGMVQWTGAPDEEIQFKLHGSKIAGQVHSFTAKRDELHVITVRPSLVIQGIVTDASQTKVTNFRATFGTKSAKDDHISWMSFIPTRGRDGKFKLVCHDVGDETYLRIEAPGYRRWTSEPISTRQSERKVFVRLERAAELTGVVLRPDGQPAIHARVIALVADGSTSIFRGYRAAEMYGSIAGPQTVHSDQNGKFEFYPADEFLAIAVHESGYAEILSESLAKNQEIQLRPWSRVEVAVKQAGQPVANACVEIRPINRPRTAVSVLDYGIQESTNERGKAIFRQVVPGDMEVRWLAFQHLGRARRNFAERFETISVSASAGTQVELGGTGTRLIGRLSVTGEPPKKHVWKSNEPLSITMTGDKSANLAPKKYCCLINDDGTFQIDDVLPGHYQLKAKLTAGIDLEHPLGEEVGQIVQEFDVMGNDPVVDLGVIQGALTQFAKDQPGKR